MIEGSVNTEMVPQLTLQVAGREWTTVVDTGFNGYLELPEVLKESLNGESTGLTESILAAGQVILEEGYLVEFPFDGEIVQAEVSYVPGESILLGTQMMKHYRLEIDFPERTVRLERTTDH